jgi:hypothetical protein
VFWAWGNKSNTDLKSYVDCFLGSCLSLFSRIDGMSRRWNCFLPRRFMVIWMVVSASEGDFSANERSGRNCVPRFWVLVDKTGVTGLG